MSLLSSSIAMLFKGFFALILAAIGYVVLQSILLPLWKMRFYKKQGIPTYFFPFFGFNQRGKISEKKDNDGMAYYRQLAQKDQGVAAEASNFGNRIAVSLFDAKLIKEFYSKQSNYVKIKPSPATQTLMGTGLLLAEGDLWKTHRKIISSKFHFEFLKDNILNIVSTTREFLCELSKASMSKVSILDEAQKITGEVVGRIFFGEHLNNYKIQGLPLTLYFARLMARATGGFKGNYLIMLAFITGVNLERIPSYKKFMDEVREFKQLCFNIVKDRKNSHVKGTDLLGLLLETQNAENPEDRFSDEDIINEFITFFLAGMDTTGHLIAMSLYLLEQNPHSLEKLRQEVDTFYPKDKLVTVDELNQMDYMQCVLKETLRLYSPAPIIFPRLAQIDHTIGDLQIKKGSSVRPTPLYNYSNPKYFEEPEKFKPERWMNKMEQNLEPYVYVPFSAGPRNCIGQHLALMEAKIIVSEFIRKFRYNLTDRDFKLVMTFNFLYSPKNKVEMDLDAR